MKQVIRVGLAALLLLGACGSDEPEMVKKVKAYKAQVCACKDEACANKVNDEITAYAIAQLSKMSEKDVEKMVGKLEGLEKEFNACYEKAAGHPPPD